MYTNGCTCVLDDERKRLLGDSVKKVRRAEEDVNCAVGPEEYRKAQKAYQTAIHLQALFHTRGAGTLSSTLTFLLVLWETQLGSRDAMSKDEILYVACVSQCFANRCREGKDEGNSELDGKIRDLSWKILENYFCSLPAPMGAGVGVS